tara:strand:- start:192 stop:1760 length:1569 start_codon:yes stop_codon:yes gene_type:complete
LNLKKIRIILYGFLSLFILGGEGSRCFGFVIENAVLTKGLSTSIQKNNENPLTEKAYKNKNEWVPMTLFERFEKALKLYNWGYPSLGPYLESIEDGPFFNKKGKKISLASSWASSQFDPELSSYLYQKKGWNCEGIHFFPGDIQELMTAFYPWEVGTSWGNRSVYGGNDLKAHEFHKAAHFHLYTGEGLVILDESKDLVYPVLKVKSSFKELIPQELIAYMEEKLAQGNWPGQKAGTDGPALFKSQFFKHYSAQGKKALRVLKFIERGMDIIQRNDGLSYSALRNRILESSFFLSVFESFEGQFKKYKDKRGLKNILNKLRFRYLKDALYNNSLSFKDGIRVEKVTTEMSIGIPGSYRGRSLKQRTLSLVYFLFQRKGKQGLNQKVAMWQYPWKKDVLNKLSQLKNQKGAYWEKYKEHLKKNMNKKWVLSELGKKSNYFIMGSTWFTSSKRRPTILFSVKKKRAFASNLATNYNQWFYDIWDKNQLPKESFLDLPRGSIYQLVGKGIGLKGLKHLSRNCREL